MATSHVLVNGGTTREWGGGYICLEMDVNDLLGLGLCATEGLPGLSDTPSSTLRVSLLRADLRLGLDTEVDRLKLASFTLLWKKQILINSKSNRM